MVQLDDKVYPVANLRASFQKVKANEALRE